MPVFDAKIIDTNHGSECPFSPPELFDGDYMELMRARYKDKRYAQLIDFKVRFSQSPNNQKTIICGPHAEQVQLIIAGISLRKRKPRQPLSSSKLMR